MKSLIFAMAGAESAGLADRLAGALEHAGHLVVVTDYWLKDGFDPGRLRRPGSLLTLSDLGLPSAPRLSHRQYVEAFGDDIDFIAVNSHTQAYGNLPAQYVLSRDLLFLESPYYQRLRGLAARIEHLLRAVQPDVVVIQQGFEVVSRMLFAKALKLHIPWLCHESPFFPGRLLLDSEGQHFFPGKNRIERDWPRVSSGAWPAEAAARARRFIEEWKAGRISKYPQISAAGERARLAAFVGGSNAPVAFVPMQVPIDANVHFGLGGFASLEHFYREITTTLPAEWKVVFKPHPLDSTRLEPPAGPADRVFVARDADIHDLIGVATAVAVFSSNVGLEALLYQKPVVVGGKPSYAGKGLTLDVAGPRDLRDAFEKARVWRPDSEQVERFVGYLIDDYLIAPDNTAALARRFEEALHRDGPPVTDARAPFYECEPERARGFVDFVRRYDRLSLQNHVEAEILAQVCPPGFAVAVHHDTLRSGERQVTAWLSRIEPGHVARYAFAVSLVPQGCEVLDIACGTGYGAYLLADRTQARVNAVDGDPATIRYARETWAHARVAFQEKSVGAFFADSGGRCYDVIVSFETLEHLPNATLFLEQAWRCLKPGGVLFVSTPNSDHYPLLDHPFHVEHLNRHSLTARIGALDGVAHFQIFEQSGRRIQGRPLPGSRFLIAAVGKVAGQGEAQIISTEHLSEAVSFDLTEPEAAALGADRLVKAFVRRRHGLIRLLTQR